MTSLKHAIKTALRPLVPNSVMARYRRHQHSQGARHPVDVYVADGDGPRRWRAFTPNTYRVVTHGPRSKRPSAQMVMLGRADDDLERYVGSLGAEAAVRGRVAKPSMVDMRIVEPRVEPVSIAADTSLLGSLGIDPDLDLPTALRLLTDAGTHIALVPEVVDGPVGGDLPPVTGDTVVVLAAVPIHDVGGGSRAAQIALELVRRGYHVVYLYAFASSEAVDLGLRYVHRHLEEYSFHDTDTDRLLGRLAPGIAIVEAPMGDFIPMLERMRAGGWRILYDVIDDWTDEALGGMWYAPVFEERIVELADGFSASAPDLQDHVRRFGREAALAPNAVNDTLFAAPTEAHVRPTDLPPGPVLGYHGSLYGDWFDWDALAAVATAFPDHVIAIIGDHRNVDRNLPSNVVFLGLKPQGALAPYLRSFDVGLVPFTLTDVTHAVSPLKVYEYLACGVPVAAPPLRALEGVDGVHVDVDLVAAVRSAMAGDRPDGVRALADHSWGARLAPMLATVGRELHDRSDEGAIIVTRPTHRYGNADRWLRG